VQFTPAARLLVHVFCVRVNCELTERVRAFAEKLPVLPTVTVCAALDCPGLTTGKVNSCGLTVSPVVVVPVPLSETFTGATPSIEDATTSVAALPPAVDGVKITCTVQLLPLVSVAPQSVVPVAKLLAPRPVI
jgi:hypothetical protein